MMKRIIGMVLASLLLLSCALEPTIQGPVDPSRKDADLTLYDATYTFGMSNGGPLAVTTKMLAFHEEEEEAVMESITFVGYEEDGHPFFQGSARHAIINTTTYDATLSKDVSLHHLDEEIQVFSDELSWSEKNQILSSPDHVASTIVIDGDITFRGKGLSIDFTTLAVTFEKVLEGRVSR